MAKCPYCNKSSGFFRKKHNACEKKYLEGISDVKTILRGFFSDSKSSLAAIKNIAEISFISHNKLNELFESVYSETVDNMLEDGLLREDEETSLAEFQEFYSINQDVLNKNNAQTKVVGASILRNMFAGKVISGRLKIDGNLPFNFLKNEKLVFLYSPVLLSEQRINTEYEGGSSGVSIRIARGLYYRTSAFKGRPIKKEVTIPISYGMMALTNKHLYFSSTKKKFSNTF